MLTREEMLRRYAAHQAAAAALEKALKDQASSEYGAQGSAVTWRLDGGKVQVKLSTNKVVVVDRDKWLDYLAARLPDEVETVTVRRLRNGAVEQRMLEILTELGPVPDAEQPSRRLKPGETAEAADEQGRVVPGVKWVRGGEYVATAIVVEPEVKRALAASATAYVAGAPMPELEA